MTYAMMAIENEILRGQVGSGLHGTGMSGQDDRDEMGVCIEAPEFVIGLSKFEQHIDRYNVATGVRKHEGERSGYGDLDLCIYSLRKYVRLAAQGNPSILALLFVPPSELVVSTPWGEALQRLAPSIISRQAGYRYLGYMNSQRMRLTGERGGGHGRRGGAKRPELVEAHGFDTKFAMHMARLPIQGIELLSTRKITFPVPEPARSWLRSVREGFVPLEDVLAKTAELEKKLVWLTEGSAHVRTEPDWHRINVFLRNAYQGHWEEHGLI